MLEMLLLVRQYFSKWGIGGFIISSIRERRYISVGCCVGDVCCWEGFGNACFTQHTNKIPLNPEYLHGGHMLHKGRGDLEEWKWEQYWWTPSSRTRQSKFPKLAFTLSMPTSPPPNSTSFFFYFFFLLDLSKIASPNAHFCLCKPGSLTSSIPLDLQDSPVSKLELQLSDTSFFISALSINQESDAKPLTSSALSIGNQAISLLPCSLIWNLDLSI